MEWWKIKSVLNQVLEYVILYNHPSCQPLFQTTKSNSSIFLKKFQTRNFLLVPLRAIFSGSMIQCHDNTCQSNVPRVVSRCSCLIFHEVWWLKNACSWRGRVIVCITYQLPVIHSLHWFTFVNDCGARRSSGCGVRFKSWNRAPPSEKLKN